MKKFFFKHKFLFGNLVPILLMVVPLVIVKDTDNEMAVMILSCVSSLAWYALYHDAYRFAFPRVTVSAWVYRKSEMLTGDYNSWSITFKKDDGTKIHLQVSGVVYDRLSLGDYGKLDYQGNKYFGFIRVKLPQMKSCVAQLIRMRKTLLALYPEYFLTFQTDVFDIVGYEIELKCSKEQYERYEQDMSGILEFKEGQLIDFRTDLSREEMAAELSKMSRSFKKAEAGSTPPECTANANRPAVITQSVPAADPLEEARKQEELRTAELKKSLKYNLEYALMFKTDSGMIRGLTGSLKTLESEADRRKVQELISGPESTVRERTKALLASIETE